MKTIFNHFATLAMTLAAGIVAPLAFAQQDLPDVGFVRIIPVLTAGTGKTHILIDGQDIYPSGYDVGQKTGGISLQAGSHSIALQKTGIRSTITSFNVERGETLNMIGYAEQVTPKNPTDPPLWKSKLLQLRTTNPESGYCLTLISLCTKDEIKVQTETLNSQKSQFVEVKRLTTTRVNLGKSKAEFAVKINGAIVTVVSPEDPGNYGVVIYEDETGAIRALSFYDSKLATAG